MTRDHLQLSGNQDKFLKIRNILNIIFMIGAIAGVLIYFYADRPTGTIIILVAMVFKMIESILRFFH